MTLHRNFLLFIILSLLVACGKKQIQQNIIPKEKMISILVDIHITDALLAKETLFDKNLKNPDSLSYYNSIFKKYGITRNQFYESFKYYMKNIEEFDEMYKVVTDTLSHRFNVLDSLILDKEKGNDIWTGKRNWKLPADSAKAYAFFSIKTNKQGIYRLTAKYYFYHDDLSLNLRMKLEFLYDDSTKNEIIRPIIKKPESWSETYITANTDTSKKLIIVRGALLLHDKRTSYMHLNIKEVRLIYNPF